MEICGISLKENGYNEDNKCQERKRKRRLAHPLHGIVRHAALGGVGAVCSAPFRGAAAARLHLRLRLHRSSGSVRWQYSRS
ncbi:hypothetical protein MVEN_01359500 [Mycena venus]|uniref:Uncharacterized protein n=1 Tax=Mycena venus TaxID=2733690 RepID=A0A8H6Y0N5_9AGAR|nr:hypothetical protein MVEN_01359500 [Mycena venus]